MKMLPEFWNKIWKVLSMVWPITLLTGNNQVSLISYIPSCRYCLFCSSTHLQRQGWGCYSIWKLSVQLTFTFKVWKFTLCSLYFPISFHPCMMSGFKSSLCGDTFVPLHSNSSIWGPCGLQFFSCSVNLHCPCCLEIALSRWCVCGINPIKVQAPWGSLECTLAFSLPST